MSAEVLTKIMIDSILAEVEDVLGPDKANALRAYIKRLESAVWISKLENDEGDE